jgi:hypothetical protein
MKILTKNHSSPELQRIYSFLDKKVKDPTPSEDCVCEQDSACGNGSSFY